MKDEKILNDSLKKLITYLKQYCFYDSDIELLKLNTLNCAYLLSNDINLDLFDNFEKYMKEIKEILHKDLESFFNHDPAAKDQKEIIIAYPGLFAVMCYRFGHLLYKYGINYLPRLICEFAHSKTGIDIHPAAEIDHSFFIDHGTGIVIGESSIIGNNVSIYHGVTLGATSLHKGHLLKGTKRHPTIGNNVIIYANATILGGNTNIGDNCIIGSNTFITSSIHSNSIVKTTTSNSIINSNK